jgi:hypothetical protein
LKDVPSGELTQIHNLIDEWEALTGYSTINFVNVDWVVLDMANNGISTVKQVGQWMFQHDPAEVGRDIPGATLVPRGLYQRMPWAFWGLNQDQWNTVYADLSTTWAQMTGQRGGIPEYWLGIAMNKGLTGGQLSAWMRNDPAFYGAYGWLRYGLDYTQFQQQKLQMRNTFGTDLLTDQQAIQQLQYLHTAQGADVQSRVQQTLTQVEKQAAQTGISGAQIR